MLIPAHVQLHLMVRIKASFDKAGRQAKRHRCVVSPLTSLKFKRTATDHVCHEREGAPRQELSRRAYRIPTRETEQSTSCAIKSRGIHQGMLEVHLLFSQGTPDV